MRVDRRISVIAVTLLAATLLPAAASAQVIHSRFPVTDGPVGALAVDGDVLYISGGFEMIGTPTGGGVPVDSSAGALVGGFPEVHGAVLAAIEDGDGGWYIAGEFDRVGATPRANLARIRRDLSVDPWNPGTDGPVFAIGRDDATVYAGGAFAHAGGQSRVHMAALDHATGAVTPWSVAVDGAVRAIALDDGIVTFGGEFTHVAGAVRNHLAAVTRAGALSSWNPDADGDVRCLAVDDHIVYAGGDFMHVSGVLRWRLCAVSQRDGSLTPWNGTANATVRAIAVGGGKVYVAGDFDRVGGQARNGIAALNKRWWQATDWYPGSSGSVTALVVQDARVYASGELWHSYGRPPCRAAAYDTVSGRPLGWNPPLGGPATAIAPSGDRVYLGGTFTLAGGEPRPGIAAINRRTERVLPWIAKSRYSWFVLPHDGEIDVSGAVLDSVDGHVIRRPAFANSAYCAALAESLVILGFVLTQGRNLCAFDRSGAMRWSGVGDKQRDGSILALAMCGPHLYVAGDFYVYTCLNVDNPYPSQACPQGLAVVDPSTGMPLRRTYYYGSTPSRIEALVADGRRVYAGGYGLSVIDDATGAITSWSRSIFVRALALDGDRLYVGGSVGELPGAPRGLAALSTVQGTVLDWRPNVDTGEVLALAAADGVVYAGGTFTRIGGAPRTNLAAFDGTTAPLTGVAPAIPATVTLAAPRPNPVVTSARVAFELPRAQAATLELLDIGGRRVATLAPTATYAAGRHEFALQGDGLAAGVYWIRLVSDGVVSTRRVVVMR